MIACKLEKVRGPKVPKELPMGASSVVRCTSQWCKEGLPKICTLKTFPGFHGHCLRQRLPHRDVGAGKVGTRGPSWRPCPLLFLIERACQRLRCSWRTLFDDGPSRPHGIFHTKSGRGLHGSPTDGLELVRRLHVVSTFTWGF